MGSHHRRFEPIPCELGIGGLLGWSANYLQTPGLLQTFLISLEITSAEQTRTTAIIGGV